MSVPLARAPGTRRGVARGLALAAALSLAVAMPGSAPAAEAGGCAFGGSARFSPGVAYVPQLGMAVSLAGTLSLCQSAPGTGPVTGTVSMGNGWTQPGALGWKWQEPLGVAQGGCISAVTRGTAIVRWDDGTATVLIVEAASGLGEIALTGAVADGVTLTASSPQLGQPSSLTVATTRFTAGAAVAGLLNVIGPEGALITCGLGGTPEVFFLGATTLVDD